VALPAFAAVRRAAARLLLTAGHATIDISCPPGPQQQTRRSGVYVAAECWDRQTDGRPRIAPAKKKAGSAEAHRCETASGFCCVCTPVRAAFRRVLAEDADWFWLTSTPSDVKGLI